MVALDAKPVWMGSREDYSAWMKHEQNRARLKDWMESGRDSDYLDLVKLFYRNMVNVYSGPSGSYNENLS